MFFRKSLLNNMLIYLTLNQLNVAQSFQLNFMAWFTMLVEFSSIDFFSRFESRIRLKSN